MTTLTKYNFFSRISETQISILDKFTNEVPVRVGALAHELGLKVVIAALPLNISGMIQPDGDGGYTIKVNRFESKERQRFTIAHEIAHFLLHEERLTQGVIDSVLYRSNLSSRLEAEANKLAADIVMPLRKVKEISILENFSNESIAIETLAHIFKVSKQAMSIRMGG